MFGKLSTRPAAGFTLPELLMAMAVASVTLTALMIFTMFAGKSFAAIENYVDLEQKTQTALDVMTRDIRQAQRLTGFGTATFNGRKVTNSVSFLDDDGTPLSFAYTNMPSGKDNEPVGVLMRNKNGAVSMLLTNVDYLSFNLFQRNPVGGSVYDQHTFSDTSRCKLISVSWVCSRSILGSKINTESVQTTKIIIRKQ